MKDTMRTAPLRDLAELAFLAGFAESDEGHLIGNEHVDTELHHAFEKWWRAVPDALDAKARLSAAVIYAEAPPSE